MINQGYAYNSPKDSSTMRIVAITSVDPATRKAMGTTRERSMIEIDCSFPVGGMIVTPAVGEQWYVERIGVRYTLCSRLPANSTELMVEAQEGQVQVGSSGPLTLHGSEVQVQSNLKLGSTLYRDTDGTLERSTDGGQTWTVALGSGGNGGASGVSSVAGKSGDVILELGDINTLTTVLQAKADLAGGKVPDTQIKHRVFQYANTAAFPATGEASTFYLDSSKKEVYAWVGGAFTIIAGSATTITSNNNIFDLNSFLDGLLPSSGSLIDQLLGVITGLTGGPLEGLQGVLDGLGDIPAQIVEAITGVLGGSLANLSQFFEGFLGFNPLTGANTLIKQLVTALTGGLFTGGLDELTTHFGGLISGAGTFLQQIIKNITGFGANGSTLLNLSTFFTNIRSFFGNIDFLPGGVFDIAGAATTFINSVLKQTNIFAPLADLQSWLTGTVGGSLQTFFDNLRSFLGDGSFLDLLSGSFNPITALNSFITNVLGQASATLGTHLIPELVVGKIGGLVEAITGEVGDSLESIQNFFAGFTSSPIVTGANNLMTQIVNSITGSDGVLADLADFFSGFIGSGSLLDQIVNAMTGIGTFASGPLATISSLFSGITTAGGNLIDQVVDSLGDFASSLDIAAMVSKITGININNLNIDPLVDLADFFDGFNVFTGANTLLSQVLTQAGSNLAPLFAAILGIDEIDLPGDPIAAIQTFFGGFVSGAGNLLTQIINQIVSAVTGSGTLKNLTDLQGFFTNLRNFFGGVTGVNLLTAPGSFDLGAMAGKFISNVLNQATGIGSTLNQARITGLIDDLASRLQLTQLTSWLGGTATTVGGALTEISTFFGNLRNFFLGTNGINFLSYNPLTAFNSFITGVINKATAQINAANIANLGMNQITNLISFLTGGSSLLDIQNFFANLRTFLGIGTGAGQTDFKATIFSLPAALNSFITNVFNQATSAINQVLIPALPLDRITNLVSYLTGGSAIADVQTFFTNLRSFLGSVNFLSGSFSVGSAAQTFINSVLSPQNILATLGNLQTWLTGTVGGSLSTFFTNLRSFLGSVDFLGGGFSVGSAATTFINSVLTPTGILSKIADLQTWLTGVGGGSLSTFFTNVRSFLGSVNFLDPSFSVTAAAQTFLTAILAPANNAVNAFAKLVSGLIPDGLIPSLAPSKITDLVLGLTGSAAGNIKTFFDNIRLFLGSVDFLSGSFSVTGAAQTFLTAILAPANNAVNAFAKLVGGLIPDGLIPTLQIGKIQDLVLWLTGSAGGNVQKFFDSLRSFFNGINFIPTGTFDPIGAATTFINNVLVPRNILAPLASLQTWLTGTVGGSLSTFFTNLRSFLGSFDFLSGTFTASGAAQNFLTAILAPANNTVNAFAKLVSGLIPDGLIPQLAPGKITDLVLGLTGSAGGNIKTFFDNIRSFLGSIDFLSGSFSAGTAAQTFLTAVLAPANNAVNAFAKLVSGLIPDGLIPQLLPSKITDLVLGLTGSAGGNIKTFFDNIRSFLGSIDFLSGSFSAGTAAQTFLTAVLAPANNAVNAFAKLVSGLIPDGLIPTLLPSKIQDLVLGLTGSASGNIKTFFDNVRSLLGSVNFLDPGFTAASAAQTFLSAILVPANNALNSFAKLTGGLIPDNLIPNLLPSKITDLVLGLTGSAGGNIKTFFDNIRLFLGSVNFLDAGFTPAAAAQTFLSAILVPANNALNSFAKLTGGLIPDNLIPNLLPSKITDLVLGLTGNASGNIKTFFDNIRSFLGSINFLDPGFVAGTAAQTFLTAVLAPANNAVNAFAKLVGGFIPDGLIPTLQIGKVNLLQEALNAKVVIDDLVTKITGAASGGMTAIQNFFSGFSAFTGSNGIINQITNSLMGAGDTLANLKTFFGGFGAFSSATGNSLLKQITDGLTGSGIAGASLTTLQNFFTNARTFLGNIDFKVAPASFATALGTNIDTFINSILKPRGVFTVVSDLATYLGGTALGDIEKFFKNMTSLFSVMNLRTTDPLSFNPLSAASAFVNWIFSQAGATIASLIPNLTSAKIPGLTALLDAKATITTLVQNVTGLANGTLANLGTFFGGLPDTFNPATAATTLVQQLVKQITGTAGVIGTMKNFFDNVRSFLGNFNFLVSPGSFSIAGAAEAFLSGVLAPVNSTLKKFAPLDAEGKIDLGLLPQLTVDTVNGIGEWVQRTAIDPIVSVLTGLPDIDLGQLGVWARNLLGRNDAIPAENIIGQISSTLLGIIPVAHIGVFSPNLLSQGHFNSAETMDEEDGWSWDNTEGYTDLGSAKTVVSSAELRELYSNQTIATTPGDRLDVSAWIKTSGFVGSSTHTVTLGSPTGGSFRLTYNGVTTVAIDRLATAATVQTALGNLATVGPSNVTVTGSAGGPYAVTITGSADQLTGTSSLTGGKLTITSTCPISLSLVPYIGTTAQLPIVIKSTGASATWEELAGETYVVPDDITSVIVRLAVSERATAGSVWWSDISLTKQGLLGQGLVDRLEDAWRNIWNGMLGRFDTNIGVDDLFAAAAMLAAQAGTALSNGVGALTQVGGLVGDLLSAPARVIGNIAEVVIDGAAKMGEFLGGMWDAFSTVPQGVAKTVAELLQRAQQLFNNANTALDNTTTNAGLIVGAQGTADDAQKLAVLNAAELTKLQSTTLPGAASVSDFDNFDYNTATLDPALWAVSSAVANAGYYRTDGSKAYWVDQGNVANTWVARFLRSRTKSSYQIITAVLDSPVVESPVAIVGSPECYTYIIGRSDATFTNYVYARIGYNSIGIWKKVGNSRIQIGSSAGYTPKPGDTVQFLCGTDGGGIQQFQIRINNSTVLTQTDSTFYGGVLSVENATTNNFGGFGGFGADRYNGQATPGAISIWSIAENYPDPILGSGGRFFRSNNNSTVASVSVNNNIFPLGWFNQVDQMTSDLTYDSQRGRVTVSVEGWYQIVIQQYSDIGITILAGGAAGRIAPVIWKGTGTGAGAVVQRGPSVLYNSTVGFGGFGGTFQVYLRPGDWIEPGYHSTDDIGSALRADTAGTLTWFSVSLLNRSYN